MAFITWNKDFSVGVAEIDKQHQKLIGMVNELHEAMGEGRGLDALEATFNGLTDYIQKHFSHEEALLRKFNYPDLDMHCLEHKVLTRQVGKLRTRYDSREHLITRTVMYFLKEWLTHHIKVIDKEYWPFLNSHGIH